MTTYPYRDGDFTVIGPECFTDADATVISYQGENYVPQAPAASPDPPDDPGVIPGPDPGACPSCGGWRKAGMIHRCEVEEDAIRADERERLSARVYENGWCPTCAATAAASPDERLREALAFYADKGNYTAQNPVGSGAHVWRDMGGRARSALAAADRPQPPADERLREAAQVAVFACLPVLHIVGSQNRGYRVSDVIDPKVIADPQEWVDAAHAICELHHVLAAADRDSGDVAIERLGNAVIEANRRGPIPPVSDDPDFLAADREKPDADMQAAMDRADEELRAELDAPLVSDDPVPDPETNT